MMKKYLLLLQQKIIKNIFYIVGTTFVVATLIPSISMGQFSPNETAFPYDIQGQTYNANAETTTPDGVLTTNVATDLIKTDTNAPTSILKRLTDFFRLSGTSYNPTGGTSTSIATNYVKWILNILLGLVSFLSLVMVIFAFYLIFFSKGEEAVGKAKKILVGVGIALAIMWLSRFIASFFFDIYTTVTN